MMDLTDSQLTTLSQTLKVIAHPTCLSIINLLAVGREMTLDEINAQLDLSPEATILHIKTLCEKGILNTASLGSSRSYSLSSSAFIKLIDCLAIMEGDKTL